MKRLRYTVSDEHWALMEEAGKALGVEPKLVLQLSASIGLRFLDMSVIHPINVSIAKAVDERAAEGAATIMSDFGKAMGQVQETGKPLPAARRGVASTRSNKNKQKRKRK